MGVNSGMLNEESRTTIQYLVPPIGGGGGGGGAGGGVLSKVLYGEAASCRLAH